MPQSVLEMAKDLVMAQIGVGKLAPENMQHALRETYSSLMALKQIDDTGALKPEEQPLAARPPADWRKSIRKHAVSCLECGAAFKQLSAMHLLTHGFDPKSYRAKYGIPRTQPLAAKATTAARQRMVQHIKPWEKAPRYREAKEREKAAQEKAAAAPTKQRPSRTTPAARGRARKRAAQANV